MDTRQGLRTQAVAGLLVAGAAWTAGGMAGVSVARLVPAGGELGGGVAVAVGLTGSALQAVLWRDGQGRGTARAVGLTAATLATAASLLVVTVHPLAELAVRVWDPPPQRKFAELGAVVDIAVLGSGVYVVLGGLPWLYVLRRRLGRPRR